MNDDRAIAFHAEEEVALTVYDGIRPGETVISVHFPATEEGARSEKILAELFKITSMFKHAVKEIDDGIMMRKGINHKRLLDTFAQQLEMSSRAVQAQIEDTGSVHREIEGVVDASADANEITTRGAQALEASPVHAPESGEGEAEERKEEQQQEEEARGTNEPSSQEMSEEELQKKQEAFLKGIREAPRAAPLKEEESWSEQVRSIITDMYNPTRANLLTNFWGPVSWAWIHMRSIGYAGEPTDAERRDEIEQLLGLPRAQPCMGCRFHAAMTLMTCDLSRAVTSRRHLMRFYFEFHNMLNAKTKKSPITEVEFVKTYLLPDTASDEVARESWLFKELVGTSREECGFAVMKQSPHRTWQDMRKAYTGGDAPVPPPARAALTPDQHEPVHGSDLEELSLENPLVLIILALLAVIVAGGVFVWTRRGRERNDK